jgi:hypothetical protein
MPSPEETPRHRASAEESARRRAAAALVAEERKRRESEIRVAVDVVLRTAAGRKLWAYLFHACGYSVTSLSHRADGEVAGVATECKEAQRLIYLNLRKLASPELRAQAELEAESQPQPTTQKEK